MLSLPQPVWVKRKTDQAIVKRIDKLLGRYCVTEIVDILNHDGCQSGTGSAFTSSIICHIIDTYSLKSRRDRMREQGYLTASEVAQVLGVTASSIIKCSRIGAMKSYHP